MEPLIINGKLDATAADSTANGEYVLVLSYFRFANGDESMPDNLHNGPSQGDISAIAVEALKEAKTLLAEKTTMLEVTSSDGSPRHGLFDVPRQITNGQPNPEFEDAALRQERRCTGSTSKSAHRMRRSRSKSTRRITPSFGATTASHTRSILAWRTTVYGEDALLIAQLYYGELTEHAGAA